MPKMSLDALKEYVKERFEQAESQDQIDMLAKINTELDHVSKEQDELVQKNAELIADYKKLVQHTSFKDEGKLVTNTDPTGPAAPSFEDVLNQFSIKGEK